MSLHFFDWLIIAFYFVIVVGLGWWMSRSPHGAEKGARDYFLAGNTLPWWAIGSSLIAANISAEQIIGMSGSGYALGLAIAAYEWMAALTLIIVAKYFLPIFLEKKIYTMPEFLEVRFDRRVRIALAIFWLLLYVFVNLPTIAYLGALALNKIVGISLTTGVIGLLLFSAIYSLWGGLKAVAWTDMIQVVMLILGGLVLTVLALISLGNGDGLVAGLQHLYQQVPEKFDLILSPEHPNYQDLPGIGVLIGGMWIANLFYWGCNQYITQRALAASSLREAQKGLALAAYLKLFMPFIVVLPGIAVFALHAPIAKPDEAYPWLLNTFAGVGVKGLALAALIAAIASSLASMVNSTATIFTMDIYKQTLAKDASDKQLVFVGRLTGLIAMVVAVFIAPNLASVGQVFQYIQEFTGLISPGIFAIFILGLFWPQATATSALWAAIVSLPLALALKFGLPQLPFIDRMAITFMLICAVVVAITKWQNKGDDEKAIQIDGSKLFATSTSFNYAALGVMLVLWLLYTFLQ